MIGKPSEPIQIRKQVIPFDLNIDDPKDKWGFSGYEYFGERKADGGTITVEHDLGREVMVRVYDDEGRLIVPLCVNYHDNSVEIDFGSAVERARAGLPEVEDETDGRGSPVYFRGTVAVFG